MSQIEADMEEASKSEKAAAKEAVAQNLYGPDATVSGDTVTYIDENGEEQEATLTDENAMKQYAAMEATEKMTEALETVPGRIAKLVDTFDYFSKGLGKAYKQLVTDEGKVTKK
jgi:hypothetical protein